MTQFVASKADRQRRFMPVMPGGLPNGGADSGLRKRLRAPICSLLTIVLHD